MKVWTTPEFKVGLLVVTVSGLIAFMSLKVSEDPSYMSSSRDVWFLIDDASGLVKNSNAKMAGINIGVIRDITLQNGQARVDLTIKSDIPLTKSARIEIRPNGILGDKHVEVIPGDPRDPPLRGGEQILVVDDRASVDRLIGEVSKITQSLSVVAENIKSATEGEGDKPLGRIINNIEQLTSDLAELSKERKEQIGDIIENVHNVTGTLDELMNDEGPDGFKAAWKDALRSLKKIEKSLANVEEITDKVNRGEGTLGRLVNDESTVDELNSAIEGINNFVDSANKTQTSLDFHSDYLARHGETKSFLSLQIQPGLDRYYEIGIVDDPSGVNQKVVTRSSVNGGTETELTENKRFFDRVKINALFAKNFYNFTIKGGVMENSGGVGFDYYLFRRNLRLSLEAFDFANTNVRASARYNFMKGLYINGGGDDLASKRASAFVGGGLFLTNDDLKMLVSKMPL